MRQALFWRHKNALNFEQMPDESIEMHEFEKEIIEHFVHEYLESDGLFILRVLSSNTSDFVCTELIQELWKYYRKQRKFNRSSGDEENEDDDDDDLNDDDDDDEDDEDAVEEFKSINKIKSKSSKRNNFQSDKSKTDSNIEENNENNNSDINDSDNRSKIAQEVSKNQLSYHKNNNRFKSDSYKIKESPNFSTKQKLSNLSASHLENKSKNLYQQDGKISSSKTLKRVLSYNQNIITSKNLVNTQLLPRKLNNRNILINEESNNLDETANSDLVETEIDLNENDKKNNSKNFVRLNSISLDTNKNKYLETET
jgi:hypothetical protein